MDAGHKETDALIDDMQKEIARNYKQAVDEVQVKLDDYFRKFEAKDAQWQKQVAAGQKSAEDYEKWRASQMLNGQRWVNMRDQLAADYHEANTAARAVVKDNMPEAYAINYNYGTYSVEKQVKVDTQFTLYDRDAATKLLTDNPDLLPQMGPPLNAAKDIAWQKGQLQSVAFQSIVQGESIPNMAKRISQTLGVQNYAAAVRYARTSVTAAQNMARQDAFTRAADMGIKLDQKWMAVRDNRTRHEHRLLDGQVRKLGEPFEIGKYKLRFPGDPECGEPSLVWNCRCRLDAAVEGWEDTVGKLKSNSAIGNMTYDEWKQAHAKPAKAASAKAAKQGKGAG